MIGVGESQSCVLSASTLSPWLWDPDSGSSPVAQPHTMVLVPWWCFLSSVESQSGH